MLSQVEYFSRCLLKLSKISLFIFLPGFDYYHMEIIYNFTINNKKEYGKNYLINSFCHISFLYFSTLIFYLNEVFNARTNTLGFLLWGVTGQISLCFTPNNV